MNLQVNQTTDPLGIDDLSPAFSWQMDSTRRGTMQTAYRIGVSTNEEDLKAGKFDVWDSGKVTSDASVDIAYGGAALASTTRYYWNVQVWDNHGDSITSEAAVFETGLLASSDWSAKWIQAADDNGQTLSVYTIEYDFNIEVAAAGFIFASADTNNFLMWQFNTREPVSGTMHFRPHSWIDGNASVIKAVPVGSSVVDEPMQHVKIEVNGSNIKTYLNDTLIDEMNSNLAAYGNIGFRESRIDDYTKETASFDNIVITNGFGRVIYCEDFSSEINVNYSCGTVSGGAYRVKEATGFKLGGSSAPAYRKAFSASAGIKSARLYSTALGIYEVEINGRKVGDDFFAPGWTGYELNASENYVMYQTYDVTDMISAGENVIGALTGHGWYSGKLFIGGNNRYGIGSKFMAQLEIIYENGDKQTIVTDESWKINTSGPILSDDFQGGETYDAREELAGWSQTGFEENSDWRAAEISAYNGNVIAQIGPSVKEIARFKPVSVTEISEGKWIVDFGQNIAGVPEISLTAPEGSVIRLRHGEKLNDDGTLYTENLRSASATDYYIFKGDSAGEIYRPRFTFHGFQYVEITGYEGSITADNITAIAISSLQELTGTFETSDEKINQLYSNILWGQRDNFISVPTDCPQRDERLGYTGDSQIFIRTASMNMDICSFFKKYMKDVVTNQRADGAIADWTPNYVTPGDGASGSFGNSAWGDAVVIIPWTIYTAYGDTEIIYDSYDAMKKWIGRYERLGGSSYLVDTCAYGDWLSLGENTSTKVISSGYYAYCCELLSKMAAVIGNTADEEYYADLFEKVRTAFNNEFVKADGTVDNGSQTAHLIALKFNLLKTEEMREKTARLLADNIIAHSYHLTTGFIGVAYLCPMLSEMGYSDIAYKLLLQETCPSWLYSVNGGATTIWERWNGYNTETGQMYEPSMNSLNHYSLGSVGEWMFGYSAGIMYDEENPGYKHTIIQPELGGGFEYLNCTFDSVYGTIESSRHYENTNTLVMNVTIPANTTATVYVPTVDVDSVTEGSVAAKDAEGVEFIEYKDGKAVYEVGSGIYEFKSTVERKMLLSLNNADATVPNVVSINGGEYRTLPLTEEYTADEKLTLSFKPANSFDYRISSVSGDVATGDSEIEVKMNSNKGFIVTNKSNDYNDLALGCGVESGNSITVGTTWVKENLTDGITTSGGGYSSDVSHTADVSASTFYVTIDLGKNTDFDTVTLYPRANSVTATGLAASFPENFTIQTMADGAGAFTTVKTLTRQTPAAGAAVPYVLDENISARYVKIAVTKLGARPTDDEYFRLQFAEIGVYNETEHINALIDKLPEPSEITIDTALEAASDALYIKEKYESLSAGKKADVDNIEAADKVLAAAEELLKILLGDLDKNGLRNVSDVVALRQVIMNNSADDYQKKAGDLDENGTLNVADVVALRRLIMESK